MTTLILAFTAAAIVAWLSAAWAVRPGPTHPPRPDPPDDRPH